MKRRIARDYEIAQVDCVRLDQYHRSDQVPSSDLSYHNYTPFRQPRVMSSSTRGNFIVLEGLDRSGKSTQVDRLVSKLEKSGRRVRLQKFPGQCVSDASKQLCT